ncbi:hypothetical protein JCM9279_006656 [Rhodotorula babjevae]
MPWAYAVPLGVGLVAVAAVAVILVEVIPAVLEERSRERHRRRRLARPVRHRVETPPPAYRSTVEETARTSGVEVPEGGWKYEVRRRKRTTATGSAARSEDAEQNRYRLDPLVHEPQHVLGGDSTAAESDFALGNHDDSNDDVPTVLCGSAAASPPGSRSRTASTSPSEPSTAPFLSPPLSASSRLGAGAELATTSSTPPVGPPTVEANPFADLVSSTAPLPSSSSPLDTASPALSCASFAPISPIPVSPPVLAPAAPVSKPASPASADEWVLPSPAPSAPASLSGAGKACSDDEDGWSRLSDEEDEWAEVRARAGEPGALRLEGMAEARAQ